MPLDNNTPEVRNTPHTRPEVAEQKPVTEAAHQQAEADMDKDLDLNAPPTIADDLDEGELARFEDNDSIEPRPEDDGE